MKTYAVIGRSSAVPPDWRGQLAHMLGAKPRRIGEWAELGLYGALCCMADSGAGTLPAPGRIWLGSGSGTWHATAAVLEQMRDDLPMPLSFLQTQPGQLLALLAAQLGWSGDARFVAGGDPLSLLRLACCGEGEILLGWVEDRETERSQWLRLRPCAEATGKPVPLDVASLFSTALTHVAIVGNGAGRGLMAVDNLGEPGGRC